MAAHKITHLDVHVLSVPAKAVHSHGSGDVSGIHVALLELTTDSGLTGWGEASPWPVFTGTVEAATAALHGHLAPHILGANPVGLAIARALKETRRVIVADTSREDRDRSRIPPELARLLETR